jgi:hypothetical protein
MALLFRSLLGYDGGVWVPNRSFWRYVLASLILSLPLFPAFVARLVSSHTDSAVANIAGALFVVMLLVAFVVNFLGRLWPIGLLVGEDGMSFADSAERMNGAIVGTLLATLAVALGVVLSAMVAGLFEFVPMINQIHFVMAVLNWPAKFILLAGPTIIGASVYVLTLLRERQPASQL